ncbi:MAG: NAD(P)H-dependent flavin oxidoreductase, partial [Alphaproteobacteria bacterium]
MLHTPLCDLLDIDVPIIQAGMGAAASASLAAAVSNAGGLGSLGTFLREPRVLLDELATLQTLTSRSFAINHVVPSLGEETFSAALEAQPKVMSFALADPGDFVRRAHDVGALVMHQITTVRQAVEAAENGADIIVAQGGEAGGYGGDVATLPLVPQVVDAVAPVPVVAAGGIYDGRGIAAALMLGAVGVNMGTRFLATDEAPFQEWKAPVLEAASEDAVKVDFLNEVMPVPGAVGYGTVMRAIRTRMVETWMAEGDAVRRNPDRVLRSLTGENRSNLPSSGQSAGGVGEIMPAGDLVR